MSFAGRQLQIGIDIGGQLQRDRADGPPLHDRHQDCGASGHVGNHLQVVGIGLTEDRGEGRPGLPARGVRPGRAGRPSLGGTAPASWCCSWLLRPEKPGDGSVSGRELARTGCGFGPLPHFVSGISAEGHIRSRLWARTPNPTQSPAPWRPLSRVRRSPYSRLSGLIRPSFPARQRYRRRQLRVRSMGSARPLRGITLSVMPRATSARSPTMSPQPRSAIRNASAGSPRAFSPTNSPTGGNCQRRTRPRRPRTSGAISESHTWQTRRRCLNRQILDMLKEVRSSYGGARHL